MLAKNELFTAILRQSNYSVTKPRRLVFNTLLRSKPMSMNELAEACSSQADRASVYRTVALFEQLDIVTRTYNGWKYKVELSETFTGHHHHITCNRCGRVMPLRGYDELEILLKKIAADHRYLLGSHQIELFGLCAQCQEP